MVNVTGYATQNWLITPAALGMTEPQPATPYDQKFLLTLSGVAICNFTDAEGDEWLIDTAFIPSDIISPLTWASSYYGLPVPPHFQYAFEVEQWAPYATMNSIFDKDQSIDAGFAVNSWNRQFYTSNDVFTGAMLNMLWAGLIVDLGVRDVDAWLYRVGFTIMLLGKIRFVTPEQ